MPKVSIVIPVYNVENYLRQCLESVVSQTLEDIEVIIVDDGSPDDSYKIYQEYEKKDKRIKSIRKENGGVSRARNTGLEAATGEYVIFIDSDDWMAENSCELLYNKSEETGADMVIADTYISFEDGKKERVHIFEKDFVTRDTDFIREYKKAIIAFPYNPMPYGRCTIPTGLGGPWNKLVRRELVVSNDICFDPYVNGMFDDCLYSLHVLAHAKTVAYISEPVYYYRIVATSILHKHKKNMLDTNRRIFERIGQYIEKYESWDEFQAAFNFYVTRRLNESLNTYFFSDDNPESLKKQLAQLKSVAESEPYKTSISKIELSLLKKSWRIICENIQDGNYFAAWVVYRLKSFKTNVLEK